MPAPYTRADAENFVREAAARGRVAGTDVVFGAIARETGEPVAAVGLHRMKARRRIRGSRRDRLLDRAGAPAAAAT
jgi:hypothetical protein